MNVEGVNSQSPKVYFAKVVEEKKQDDKAPIGLLQSAIDASEKILADSDSVETENHVDLEA